MYAVISHATALAYLDKCARVSPDASHCPMPILFEGGFPDSLALSKRDLRELQLARFARKNAPIDVLVPDQSSRRLIKGFVHHSAGGELPPGSLLDAGGGVLVCSAPLLFVQLCQGLTPIRCIKLGHFICGTYSIEPSARSGIVERRPLSSIKELRAFVRAAHRLRGSRNAAAALSWVLEGAASPKETELALPFYLPKRMGGYGFAAPVLNHVVRLSSEAMAIEGTRKPRIDVCWPDQRFGFEYNSYAEHGDPHKIGKDERRRLALRLEKYEIELVSDEQLRDPRQIEILAHMLADHGVPQQL